MRLARACIFAIALAAGPAMAHGDHDTGSPQGAEAEHGWWLDLVPRASAAQQMEIDERPNEPFLFFAADKTDPGAYNLPLYLAFADPMNTPGLLLSPVLFGWLRKYKRPTAR